MRKQKVRYLKMEDEVKGVVGRRPTCQGFEYLIDWWTPDGSVVRTAELASDLESSDPDFWLPLLDLFDLRFPTSREVIGEW